MHPSVTAPSPLLTSTCTSTTSISSRNRNRKKESYFLSPPPFSKRPSAVAPLLLPHAHTHNYYCMHERKGSSFSSFGQTHSLLPHRHGSSPLFFLLYIHGTVAPQSPDFFFPFKIFSSYSENLPLRNRGAVSAPPPFLSKKFFWNPPFSAVLLMACSLFSSLDFTLLNLTPFPSCYVVSPFLSFAYAATCLASSSPARKQ